jgi:hypothetical protein
VRYVHYWDVILSEFAGKEPPSRTIRLRSLRVESSVKIGSSIEMYLIVEENNKVTFDSRNTKADCRVKSDGWRIDPLPSPPPLTGDVRFSFFQRSSLFSDERLFHFWINTALCKEVERFTKAELDGGPAKGRDQVFCKELAVEVHFEGPFSSAAATVARLNPSGEASSNASSETRKKDKGFFRKFFE